MTSTMNGLQSLINGKRWDDLVEYLNTEEGRDESIRAHDGGSFEPLHEMLKVELDEDHQVPLSVIEAILDIFPNEPARYSRQKWRGNKGYSALQLAIISFARRQENRITLSSIVAMLKSCPEASTLHCPVDRAPTIHFAAQNDRSNNGLLVKALLECRPELVRVKLGRPYSGKVEYPLTLACERGNNGAIEVLLDAYPKAAMRPISSCQYPLHVACGQRKTSPKVIERIMSVHPPAVFVLDQSNRSPLHLGCFWKHIDAIAVLIKADPSAALSSDSNGDLPLHLALGVFDDIHNPSYPSFSIDYIYYPSFSISVLRSLLDAYPKGLFHYNHQGQLPIHCFVWAEWRLRNDERLKEYFLERHDENINYESQRELLLHLLEDMYHQIYFVYLRHNVDGDKNDCTDNDDERKEKESPVANIWHLIAIQSTMYTKKQFDRLIYILTELQVVENLNENNKVLETDRHGNNLLHLFFLSQTDRVQRWITENSGDGDNEDDFDDEADSSSSRSSQNSSEEDSEDEFDDEDSYVYQEGTYAFEDFMESVDEHTVDTQASVWTMSKQWNHHGELPFHIFLKKPCRKYINAQCNDKTEQRNNVCIKYYIMTRLMKYHPSAVSEKERNKSGLMPFMIAAVHSNKSNADETRGNECTQCLSCIYELLRSAGVGSCHIIDGECCCPETMDHPSKKNVYSSDQPHDGKKRRAK